MLKHMDKGSEFWLSVQFPSKILDFKSRDAISNLVLYISVFTFSINVSFKFWELTIPQMEDFLFYYWKKNHIAALK